MILDARGVSVRADDPQRIVSLVPSTTETLYALGAADRLVGVTRFCVHPERARHEKIKVGGTKDVDWERLDAIQPDLVFGNVEENSREIADGIASRGWPLYMAFPKSVDDAVEDLGRTAALVGCERAGERAIQDIRAARENIQKSPFTYLYLIWRGPWMAAGEDTFIAAMLGEVGGRNVLPGRYPNVDPARLPDADVVLLSSEPFPFAEKHRHELAALSGLEVDRLRLIDGESCSWHGVRMADAFATIGPSLRTIGA